MFISQLTYLGGKLEKSLKELIIKTFIIRIYRGQGKECLVKCSLTGSILEGQLTTFLEKESVPSFFPQKYFCILSEMLFAFQQFPYQNSLLWTSFKLFHGPQQKGDAKIPRNLHFCLTLIIKVFINFNFYQRKIQKPVYNVPFTLIVSNAKGKHNNK